MRRHEGKLSYKFISSSKRFQLNFELSKQQKLFLDPTFLVFFLVQEIRVDFPLENRNPQPLFKWRVLLAMELGLYWFDLYFLLQLKNLCSACSEFLLRLHGSSLLITLRSKQWRSPFHVVNFTLQSYIKACFFLSSS